MGKRKEFLIYGSPLISQEDINEVLDTIKSGWLGTGPKTHLFENKFSQYRGVKHCVAVSSCTAALHLAMLAAGIGPGDEVIIPAMTFCATANAVVHAGATPIFADICLPDMTLNPEEVERKISPKTKALIPVHFHGRPAKMDELETIAEKNKLLIIDDAAHAVEAFYQGKKIGQWADITCFSFYITKNLTTVEGGMVATDNEEWAKKIKIYALHGMSDDAWGRFSDKGYRHYQVDVPGFKYNMTDIQSSFGLHQIEHLEERLSKREEIWHTYNEAFKNLPLILPPDPAENTVHARHIYAICTREDTPMNRDELMQALYEHNIGTGVHYTALHLHKYYSEKFGYKKGDFPNSETVGGSTLSLPLSPKLTVSDINDVVTAVNNILT